MNLLFDSSAILNTVRNMGGNAISILKSNYILTLTIYEIGNAIWKEAKLQKRIGLNEALILISNISRILSKMRIIVIDNPAKVLRVAYLMRITYYDASYITATAENNLILVTDDRKLLNKIGEREEILRKIFKTEIRVITSSKL